MPQRQVTVETADIQSFSRAEILAAVSAESPTFCEIPDESKWCMALWAAGASADQIQRDTGMEVGTIRVVIDSWARFIRELPDLARSKLSRRLLWLASSSYAAKTFDSIAEMGVRDAIFCMEKIPGIMADMVKTEKLLMLHERDVRAVDVNSLRDKLTKRTGTSDDPTD